MSSTMFGWYPTRASSSVSTNVKVDAKKLNDSVYELHKPPGKPSVQIVFFHGLYTGDSSDAHLWTWESEDGSCVWPATWLVEEFPAAHILSVSYCGSVGKSFQGRLDMHNIGENLISDLMHANIGQTPYCPVILVGYCFGGLVIKELCCQISLERNLIKSAGGKKKLETFLDNLRGVFYYGTPHGGSPVIDKVTLVVESPLLQYFSTLSKDACRLNHRFDQLYRASNWRVDGLGENLPAKVGIFKGIVVASETSARGGDLFNVLPVEHFTICKPSSKTDKRFYALTNLLHSVAENQEAVHKCQGLPRYPIDLERRAREVQEKLITGEVVGLVGMGGLGKTTLAKQVFNYISREFKHTCFVESVKGIPRHELENSILSGFHQSGRKMDRNRTSWSDLKGKTLIIMDDVNSETQLQMLPALNSFGKGSRLVVTSRDESIFSCLESFDLYVVDFLHADQAKKLFCLHADLEEALGDSEGTSHLEKNMKAVVDKCGGLPLTLEVIGCYLRGRATDVTYWKDTLKKLGKAQSITGSGSDRVWNTLKVSYDSLAPREQKMFIEASIHFFGKSVDIALAAWEGAYETSKTEWENLIRRSLVKVVSKTSWESREKYPFDNEHKTVWVHEHLRDLATSLSKGYMVSVCRDIGDSPTSRCLNELNTNDVKVNAKIVSIRDVPLHSDSVAKLKKLRYLDLLNVKPEGSFENFPRKLSLLRWRMQWDRPYLFPSCSHNGMRNLAVLELENWLICEEFPQLLGSLTNLRILSLCNLRGLDHLSENFGNLSGLEKLELRNLDLLALPLSFGCLSSLREVTLQLPQLKCLPDNICQLQRLTKLIIGTRRGSVGDSLQTLPDNLGLLSCLEHLGITSQRLRMLPESLGDLSQLKTLFLHVDKIKVLPASVGQLSLLREVSLTLPVDCLPESILQLSSLRTLEIVARNLKSLPDCFTNLCSLQSLEIKSDSLESLPESVGCLSSLRKCVIESGSLRRLPDSIGHLSAMQFFTVKCRKLEKLPESFGLLSALQKLTLEIDQSTYFPDNEIRFRVLKELVVRRTRQGSDKIDRESLETLLDNLGPLLSLERLEIKCPFLKMLPESLGKLTRLEVLSLEVEAVKVLPGSVGQLSALRELHFISAVDYLPESLGLLSSLKTLRVASKNLAKLPDSLQNLSSLEILGIVSNNLESLPESIVRLSSLKGCHIASKILRLLPKSILEMSAFRSLSIQHFDNFPFYFPFVSRGTLSIHSNSLDRLPESIGQSSDLKSLPDSIGHWPALRSMTIKCPRLEKLPDSLGLLSALEELTLEIGQSKCLPENLCQLQILKKLVIIVTGEHSDNVDKDGLEMLLDNLGVLSCLEHLTIKCPSLKMLPDSFGELTRLETLCLDVRAVKVLPATVGQLSALRELELTCAVDYLPESLGQLSSLKTLRVASKNLAKLPDSLQNLSSLEVLAIVSNNLESLPESILLLSSLKGCHIASKILRLLPKSILEMPAFRSLSIQHFGNFPSHLPRVSRGTLSIHSDTLDRLPESIGQSSDLTIESSDLKSLPDSIGHWPALRSMTIKCPRLEKLPDSLGLLSALEELTLEIGQSKCLPENLCQLQILKKLVIIVTGEHSDNVDKDGLEMLLDNLGVLSCLEHLTIKCPSLKMLPDSFGELTRLETLCLDVRAVKVLPATVGQLSALRELELTCAVDYLPESLGQLSSLKTLRVASKNLAKLPDSLQNLSSLEVLAIVSNNLESLPESILLLSSLKGCHIASKILRLLPKSILEMPAFRSLSIQHFGNFPSHLPFVSRGTLSIHSDTLDRLPESIGQSSDLTIESSDLKSLPDSIGHWPALRSMTIKCPRLEKLPDSLGLLSALEELTLKIGQSKCLSENLCQIQILKKLVIIVTGEHSDKVDKDGLEMLLDNLGVLSCLEHLTIKCPSLKMLPDSLGELTRLETLCLDVRAVKVLPATVGQLSALRELDFTSAVDYLPESLGQLSSLEVLRVGSDNLANLPSSFQNLCSLEEFSIVAKCLVCIPECIGLFSSLRKCSVVSETLRSLPESMGQLSALEALTIKCLNLDKLPDSLGNLASLRRLDVYGERMVSRLSESIGRLCLLNFLSVESESWTSVPSSLLSTVRQLSSLHYLLIKGVTLEMLPDSLGELTALESLSIHARSLAIIPDSIGRLSSLRYLSVESEYLRSLPSSVGKLSALETLKVKCNNLEQLPDSFGDLSSLTRLFVHESGEERFQETKKQLSSWGWIPMPLEDVRLRIEDKKWWFRRNSEESDLQNPGVPWIFGSSLSWIEDKRCWFRRK